MSTKQIPGLECTCEACGHKWKTCEYPGRCPKCFSRTWNSIEEEKLGQRVLHRSGRRHKVGRVV